LSLSKSQLSISIIHSSSATSAPDAITTIAAAQSTESAKNEKDRANEPETTTVMAEATLPQISIFDRETLSPGVMTIYQIESHDVFCSVLNRSAFACFAC